GLQGASTDSGTSRRIRPRRAFRLVGGRIRALETWPSIGRCGLLGFLSSRLYKKRSFILYYQRSKWPAITSATRRPLRFDSSVRATRSAVHRGRSGWIAASHAEGGPLKLMNWPRGLA